MPDCCIFPSYLYLSSTWSSLCVFTAINDELASYWESSSKIGIFLLNADDWIYGNYKLAIHSFYSSLFWILLFIGFSIFTYSFSYCSSRFKLVFFLDILLSNIYFYFDFRLIFFPSFAVYSKVVIFNYFLLCFDFLLVICSI